MISGNCNFLYFLSRASFNKSVISALFINCIRAARWALLFPELTVCFSKYQWAFFFKFLSHKGLELSVQLVMNCPLKRQVLSDLAIGRQRKQRMKPRSPSILGLFLYLKDLNWSAKWKKKKIEPLGALRSLENPHSVVTVSLTTKSESAGVTAFLPNGRHHRLCSQSSLCLRTNIGQKNLPFRESVELQEGLRAEVLTWFDFFWK